MVTEKACDDPSRSADVNGVCVCSSGSVEISGNCVDSSTLLVATIVPVFILALLAFYINGIRKRRMADSVWIVQPSELKYDNPPKVIGEGSFGRVYLAEYRTTEVAVKCIHPERSSKRKKHSRNTRSTLTSDYAMEAGAASAAPEQVVRSATGVPEGKSLKTKVNNGNGWWNGLNSKSEFMNEMRLLSKLRHPCVTTVMGAVISKQTGPMMVMEYMANGSLYDVLHNMLELDGELIVSIMNDISSGVRFLHNTKPPLVHGDLKSHNVLVRPLVILC
jgi:serine/threonine protein kinase